MNISGFNLTLNQNSTMTKGVPSGVITTKEYNISSTMSLMDTFNYTIVNDGVVLKDSLYKLYLSFNNVPTNKDFNVQVKYFVKDIEIFNVYKLIHSSTSLYKLDLQVINQLNQDMNYVAGDVVKLELYLSVQNETNNVNLLFNSLDDLTMISRNAPLKSILTIVDNIETQIGDINNALNIIVD